MTIFLLIFQGELNEVLWTDKNDEIRERYEGMEFMDWMYVCFGGAHNVHRQVSEKNKPLSHASPIGYRQLRFYNYEKDQLEEYVGYRCPMEPLLYVYFVNLGTVGTLSVIHP